MHQTKQNRGVGLENALSRGPPLRDLHRRREPGGDGWGDTDSEVLNQQPGFKRHRIIRKKRDPPHTTNRSTGTGSPHDEPAPATQLVSTSSHTVGRDGRGGAGTPASARARQGRGPSHADLSPLVSAGRRRSTEAWTQCFHSCDDPEAPAHSRWGTRVSPAARL